MKIETILIPTDFSESGQAAVVRGFELARRCKAAVRLLHILRKPNATPMFPVGGPAISSTALGGLTLGGAAVGDKEWLAIEDALRSELQQVAQQHAENVECTTTLETSDDVAQTIVRWAREPSTSMIIMGTHGHRGAQRLLMGSVAEEVVRTSPCRVLTVGAGVPVEKAQPKKILGALDLAGSTDLVVAEVQSQCRLYGAEAHYIHAVPTVELGLYLDPVTTVNLEPQALLDNADARLRRQLEESGVDPSEVHSCAVAGRAHAEIVRYAEDKDIDLVVVGTHSRVGLPHVFLGSVADRVVRTAPCPVLTVPSQKKQDEKSNSAA